MVLFYFSIYYFSIFQCDSRAARVWKSSCTQTGSHSKSPRPLLPPPRSSWPFRSSKSQAQHRFDSGTERARARACVRSRRGSLPLSGKFFNESFPTRVSSGPHARPHLPSSEHQAGSGENGNAPCLNDATDGNTRMDASVLGEITRYLTRERVLIMTAGR